MEESNIIRLADIEDKLKAAGELKDISYSFNQDEDKFLDSPFLESATVLIFYDPDLIQPAAGHPLLSTKDRNTWINELIGYSEMVLSDINDPKESVSNNSEKETNGPAQKISYFLRDDIRTKIVKKLFKEGRVLIALDANKEQTGNTENLLQYFFTQSLLGKIPDFEKMNLQELNAIQRISEWFDWDERLPLPSKKLIKRLIEIAELLTPFKHLTGKYIEGEFVEQFRGRKNELSILRQYVGVAATQGFKESIGRLVQDYLEPVLNWDKKPPLLIFGLGGVGKSTLLAKFILDHAETHATNRFPFVYLDFDKPGINALEPETLLIESSRQLSVQYVDMNEIAALFLDFFDRWKDRQFISLDEKNTQSIFINADTESMGLKHSRDAMISEFIVILQRLSTIEKKPFLIVLDTFEEVQYKGRVAVKQLYDFMLILQTKYALLRVVVAGRAPVSEIKTQELELSDLDAEAAIGFLQKSGIDDDALAKKIISKVGGNPLTLKLAAELVKNYGNEELNSISLTKKKLYLFEQRLPQIQIQGILYRRILNHIHDPKILKLANPGLVLREITADLIYNVLAKPCELDIKSMDEAVYLFEEIAKEVSLVTRTNPETIRHRPDVRKVMLNLIKDDMPDLVLEIHNAAIAYYQQKEGIPAKAEELYHRLCINESPRLLDSLWVPGIENYLLGSIDEFPPKAQAFLSGRTGLEISDSSIWDDADVEDSERRFVRMAANMLNSGHAEKVLELIKEQNKDDKPGTGINALFTVRALMQLNRNDEAVQLIKSTINSFYADQINPKVKAELTRCLQKLSPDDNHEIPGDIPGKDNSTDMNNPGGFEYSF